MAKLLLANPKKRRRKAPAKRRSLSTVSRRKVRRTRRRNPIASKGTVESIKSSFVGAIGAIGVDFATNQVMQFLPAQLQGATGTQGALVKGAVSVALGYGVSKFGKNRKLGAQIAEGGLTVAIYEVAKGQLASSGAMGGMYDSGLLGMDNDGLLGYSGVARQFDPAM